MPKLIVEKGADKGKEFDVTITQSLVIGRESQNFKLRDSWASRQHFKIEHRDDGYYLVDMNSMNGTFLNGKKVSEGKLNFGDLIKVGETMFSFVGEGGRDPLIGEKVGGYRIVERIGRGGMGTVYKAEQVDLQRVVALKVISPEFARNREFIDRFIHEARAAGKLNHPNVVQVYDVKRHNDAKRNMDVYFFSMEYMEGGSVQSLISALKKLPPAKAVPMILDAARGLDYAHKKQIVHRDIKPDNMMLNDTGMVKIGDLGLAAGPQDRATNEEEKYVLGTPHYIAPEQLLGKPADYRSDIYSLGSSLYRLLAGHAPFTGASVQEIVNRKVREDPPPIHEVAEGVSENLGAIVTKMMARDPALRYQTMQEAVSDLAEFTDLIRMGGKTTVRVSSDSTPPAETPRARGMMIGVAALFAVTLAIAGFFAFGRNNGQPVVQPPPPPGNGNGNHVDPEKIQMAFENAKLKKDAHNRSDEASINAVMALFQKIVDDYPEAPQAEDAKTEIAMLKAELRGLQLKKAVKQAEIDGNAAFAEFENKFVAGEEPADDRVRAVLTACSKILDEFKELPEASQTRNVAGPIEKWLAAMTRERGEFAGLRKDIEAQKQGLHWAKADTRIGTYLSDHAERLSQAGLPEGAKPFGRLLYDRRAEEMRTALGEEAKTDFAAFDRTIEEFTRGGRLPEARLEMEQREADFKFEATEKSLRKTQKVLDGAIADYEVKMVAAKEREEREKLEADHDAFDSVARSAYEQRKQNYDFGESVKKLETLRGQLKTDAYRERVDRRIEELNRVVAFQDRFAEAFNKSKPADFKTDIIGGTNKYRVLEIQRDRVKFEYERAPGVQTREFSKVRDMSKVLQLYEWDFKDRTLVDNLCVAIMAGEIGMLDSARDWLEDVAKDTADNETDQKAIDEAKARLAGSIKTESVEVEGLKRFDRLRYLMGVSDYDKAAEAISELKAYYSNTASGREMGPQLEAWWGVIEKERGAALKAQAKRFSRGKADSILQPETKAMEKAILEMPAKLANVKFVEEGSREAFTGMFLAGAQAPRPAIELFKAAATIAEKPRADVNNVVMLNAYMAWAEALVASGQPGLLANTLDRGERFQKGAWLDGKVRPVWEKWRPWVEKWDRELKAAEEQVAELQAAWEEDADDPARVWALADHYFTKMRDYREARPLLRLLLNVGGEYEHVTNGDALYRYAEACFRMGDYEKALTQFDLLMEKHPSHERVRDTAAADGPYERIRMCKDLRAKP